VAAAAGAAVVGFDVTAVCCACCLGTLFPAAAAVGEVGPDTWAAAAAGAWTGGLGESGNCGRLLLRRCCCVWTVSPTGGTTAGSAPALLCALPVAGVLPLDATAAVAGAEAAVAAAAAAAAASLRLASLATRIASASRAASISSNSLRLRMRVQGGAGRVRSAVRTPASSPQPRPYARPGV
jgi:hypothetical protein